MDEVEVRLGHWVDVTAELLSHRLTTFPHARIQAELAASFPVVNVAWNWLDANGSAGFELCPDLPGREVIDGLCQGEFESVDRHPLLRWYAVTGDPRAQTIRRVPDEVGPREAFRAGLDILATASCEEQLSIPYVLGPCQHRAFVLARTGADFGEVDLVVARRLQPLIAGLHAQCQVIGSFLDGAAGPAGGVELTGRETAVLGLLLRGHTAVGIARRLTLSPRTVEKHLEHSYRKLGVHDRLGAAQAAATLGLVPAASEVLPPQGPRGPGMVLSRTT